MNAFWSKHRFTVPLGICLSGNPYEKTRFLNNYCLKKLKFRRPSEAIGRISVLKVKDPSKRYGYYKCSMCGGYHVTTHLGKGDVDVESGTSQQRRRKRRTLRMREEFNRLGLNTVIVEVP